MYLLHLVPDSQSTSNKRARALELWASYHKGEENRLNIGYLTLLVLEVDIVLSIVLREDSFLELYLSSFNHSLDCVYCIVVERKPRKTAMPHRLW